MNAPRRVLVATAAAALLAGCGGEPGVPPSAVAGAFARELADIDSQLAGVVRVLPDDGPATRVHAERLWGRAVRADVDLRRRLDLSAPGGRRLRSAAEDARAAAQEINDALAGVRSPPSAESLETSAAALRAAFRTGPAR